MRKKKLAGIIAACTIAIVAAIVIPQLVQPPSPNSEFSIEIVSVTSPGSWLIVVTATYEGKTTSQETYFTVK